ncbi:MAG: hypothetical protein JRJ29_09140 [Deltaproteobacteria bacterium]|nr:hypothetical protein [Deltaproteobacteria bacterium]
MTKDYIAIVGPGRMGVGIATAVLMADLRYHVTLIDIKKRKPGRETETLERACKEIKENLDLLKKLGALQADVSSLMENLSTAHDLEDSQACGREDRACRNRPANR